MQGQKVLEAALKATKTNPERFGLVGGIGRFASEITGALKGLPGSSIAQGLLNIIEGEKKAGTLGAASTMFKGKLSSDAFLENGMVFIRARVLQPTGRLLAATIERAKADVNLTGVTGAENVADRLRLFLEQLKTSLAAVNRQLSPQGQPVQGKTPGAVPRFRLNSDGSVERVR